MSGDKHRETTEKPAVQPAAGTPAGEPLADAAAAIVVTPDQPCAKRRKAPDPTPAQDLIEAISSHNAATARLNRALFDYAEERPDRR